jgi:hypothetical protein
MGAWSVPISEVANRAGAQADAVVRKLTFEIFKAVVLKSPVDTGRFRANWNISADVPDYSTTPSTIKARGGAEAARALSFPSGGVVYLSNGLPYARVLEDGSSKQAPQGMVKVTVAEFDTFLKKALR